MSLFMERDFNEDSFRLPKTKWLRKFIGWHRLNNGGFCPACYSSPPLVNCRVCHGSDQYSYKLQPSDKAVWWEQFKTEYLT